MKTKCNVCEKNIPFLCEECLLKLQIDLIKQSRNQALKDFVEECRNNIIEDYGFLVPDGRTIGFNKIESIAKELGAKNEKK
jgi:hypothetical protein